MNTKIKETCSCGAIFEYEEYVKEVWESESSYKQEEFHKAHENCRKKEIKKL